MTGKLPLVLLGRGKRTHRHKQMNVYSIQGREKLKNFPVDSRDSTTKTKNGRCFALDILSRGSSNANGERNNLQPVEAFRLFLKMHEK